MIGLVNVVRCCCAPARRPSVLLPFFALFLLVIAVCYAAREVLGAVGNGAPALEAANRAVGATVSLGAWIVGAVVVLAVAAALVWGTWSGARSARARRQFDAHNRALDAHQAGRRADIAAGLPPRQWSGVGGGIRPAVATPPPPGRQRVTSRRVDRVEPPPARPDDREPVDLDALVDRGRW